MTQAFEIWYFCGGGGGGGEGRGYGHFQLFCWIIIPTPEVSDLENSVMFTSKYVKVLSFAYIFESLHFRMLMCD